MNEEHFKLKNKNSIFLVKCVFDKNSQISGISLPEISLNLYTIL